MRKFTTFAIAVIFIFGAIGVYACGDNGCLTSKANASSAESKTTQSSTKNCDASVKTTQSNKNSKCDESVKASCVKGAHDSACCLTGKAGVTTSDAKVKTSDTEVKVSSHSCRSAKSCSMTCGGVTTSSKAKTDGANKNSSKVKVDKKSEKSDK